MKKLALTIGIVFAFSALAMTAALAQAAPPPAKPSGGTMQMKNYTMLQTSVAKRMNVTGTASIGTSANGTMITVDIKGARKNTAYGMWFVDRTSMLKLGGAVMSDDKGNATLNWTGKVVLGNYTDLAVYYLPKANSVPRKDAIRMLTLPVKQISTGAASAGKATTKPTTGKK